LSRATRESIRIGSQECPPSPCRPGSRRFSDIARAALAVPLLGGCGGPKAGVSDTPPLPPARPGVYSDIAPRFSHDGRRIAFLRTTPDRRLQLFVADAGLDRATALLEPELVCPDRPYWAQRTRYASPDGLAWSPNDRRLAFSRVEWFQFDDGQRLPGTGIWSFDLRSGRVSAIALHPKRYANLYYYYHSPSWSPDGRYVAFVAEGLNGQHALGIRCAGVEMPKEVAPRFDNYASSDWPSWRPAPAQLTGLPTRSPTGPELAFCQAIFRTQNVRATATVRTLAPGSADPSSCREALRLTPARYASTEGVRRRANPLDVVEPRVSNPVWSPNGRFIACVVSADTNDPSRSEIWVTDTQSGAKWRASPIDGRGYAAPVWIGGRQLGALRPRGDRFEAVVLDVSGGAARSIGPIDTADCDWSPDRSRIVYAVRPTNRANSADDPTTLAVLETHLSPASASPAL